jgi:hypothetical protein
LQLNCKEFCIVLLRETLLANLIGDMGGS